MKDGGGVAAVSNLVLADWGSGDVIDIKSSESFLTAPPIRNPDENRPKTPLSSLTIESPFLELLASPSWSPPSPSTFKEDKIWLKNRPSWRFLTKHYNLII